MVPAGEEIAALLDRCQQRLTAALRGRASQARLRLDAVAARRPLRRPLDRVHELAQRLDEISARSLRAVRQNVAKARALADARSRQIHALSPLSVLERGYSLTQRWPAGGLIRSAADVAAGDELVTRLAAGEIISRVEETRPDS